MSFNLSVTFSGLLHYIENQDPDPALRLCVVLPNADGHSSVIQRVGRTLLRDEDGDDVERLNFSLNRLSFELDREVPSQAFNFRQAVLDGPNLGAIPIRKMILDLADRNPNVVAPDALFRRDGVRAQVLVERGAVFSLLGTPADLEVPGDCTTRPEVIHLAPAVRMVVHSLRSAQVVLRRLGGSRERRLTIDPGGQAEAGILISHLCARAVVGPPPEEDRDFRFHYRLLTDQSNAFLPVPRIRRRPRGTQLNEVFGEQEVLGVIFGLGAGGCNCVSCGGLARPLS